MKGLLLICFGAVIATGCISRKEVVYTEPAPTVRTTVVREPVVVREPAGTVRVYDPDVRYYRTPMHPRKLGEYHQRWYY